MPLKPQDIFVVLKILANDSRRTPYVELAGSLGMSASEAHASVQRAVQSHLLHGPEMQHRPNVVALEEFLVHGLRYAFPAEHGEFTRGVATSYAAEPLSKLIPRGNDPIPVWPSVDGKERGVAFSPLYRTAPLAALRDRAFYEYLVLADALRDGRARERKIAEGELHTRLGRVNA